MTTKNLARTVIEGGRTGYYKAEVHKRSGQERAKSRVFLRALALDPESLDDSPAPARRPVTPSFDDKLNPIYQFLDTRVGRPWDATRSELFKKFDTRTTPGRHVLFDHLLRSVCQDPGAPLDAPHRRYTSYFVDTRGVLHKEERRRYRGSGFRWTDLGPVAAWLSGRKVGRAGASFFWFLPTCRARITTVVEQYALVYAFADERGEAIRDARPADPDPANDRVRRALGLGPKTVLRRAAYISFRQSRRLDADEEAFLRRLSPEALAKVLELAPANV